MNVVFEEEKIAPLPPVPRGKFIEWLLRNRIVRTEAQGQMVSIALIIILFGAMIWMWMAGKDVEPVSTTRNFVPAVVGR